MQKSKHVVYRRSSFTYTATVPQLKSGFAGTTVATDCVKTVLIAGIRLLALVYICVNTDSHCQKRQSQQIFSKDS